MLLSVFIVYLTVYATHGRKVRRCHTLSAKTLYTMITTKSRPWFLKMHGAPDFRPFVRSQNFHLKITEYIQKKHKRGISLDRYVCREVPLFSLQKGDCRQLV